MVEKRLEDIVLTSETSNWRCIVEITLTIPVEFNHFFADYPLASSLEVVDINAIGNERVDIIGNLGIITLTKVPKLLQSLHPKDDYVLQ